VPGPTSPQRVTAEGVETLAQARALKAMACDGLQGYYFSRPVLADGVPALLRATWSLDAEPQADAALRADPEAAEPPYAVLATR